LNLQAKIYYPLLIGFSTFALLFLTLFSANLTLSIGVMISLLVLSLYGISIGQLGYAYISSLGEYIRRAVGVVSIVLPVALYIKASEALIAISGFSLPDLLHFVPSAFFALFPLAISFYGIFLLSVFLYRIFLFDMDSNYRIAFITGSVTILYTIVYYTIGFHVAPIPFALAATSYFFLMDLYVERYSPSIVWSVLWNVMLCSYLSMILFAAHNSLLIANGEEVLPIVDALSFFSVGFIFSSGILFIFSRIAELPLFDDSILSLFKRRRLLQDRIQYTIITILIFSFAITASISIFYFNNFQGDLNPLDFLNNRFIHALLNAYVFLFLIGFGLVVSISSYITRPITNLGSKLQQIKLSRQNETIEWESEDEIGSLIQEYNGMIKQLESNAKILAQSERDTAWREMARQVAHEIKNPLTPMKLSLQHMQRTVHGGDDSRSKDIVDRMCNTLMEQIDNLSQISNEFSNFATLPTSNNNKILLNEVVETVHDLFRKRDDMDIQMIEPIDDVIVYADKNNLIRILNNLIKNAIQAIPTDRKGEIVIQLYKDQTKGYISVKDNGTGIPKEMEHKIFKPNFTTKTSGTGLGLAIAANMVESFGGNIYFESDGYSGSTFYIEIPLNRVESLY